MKNIKYSSHHNFISKLRPRKERVVLKRQFIDLLGGKCIDCGYNAHLAALDFDHVNPKDKTSAISTLMNSRKHTHEDILKEVLKCVIRCANCHRIKTHPDATD